MVADIYHPPTCSTVRLFVKKYKITQAEIYLNPDHFNFERKYKDYELKTSFIRISLLCSDQQPFPPADFTCY